MVCGLCDLKIDIDKISCAGFCERSFHYGCANIDRVVSSHCLKYPNILWFCDECRDLLSNRSFQKFVFNGKSSDCIAPQWQFDVLKNEIVANRKLIEELMGVVGAKALASANILPARPTSPLFADSDLSYAAVVGSNTTYSGCSRISTSNCANNEEDVNAAVSISSSKNSSSAKCALTSFTNDVASIAEPLEICLVPAIGLCDAGVASSAKIPDIPSSSSPSLNVNSAKFNVVSIKSSQIPQKNHAASICGTNKMLFNLGVKSTSPKKWFHLSKFDPATTDKEVLSVANVCLGVNNCRVFKLVPKNSKQAELEYACFKLGINEDLAVKALDPDTWPIGVCVRPFINSNFRISGQPRAKFWTKVSAVRNPDS